MNTKIFNIQKKMYQRVYFVKTFQKFVIAIVWTQIVITSIMILNFMIYEMSSILSVIQLSFIWS